MKKRLSLSISLRMKSYKSPAPCGIPYPATELQNNWFCFTPICSSMVTNFSTMGLSSVEWLIKILGALYISSKWSYIYLTTSLIATRQSFMLIKLCVLNHSKRSSCAQSQGKVALYADMISLHRWTHLRKSAVC